MGSATLTGGAARARSAGGARTELLALGALTALALALRLTSLSRGLFTDEAYSLALAQRSFGHMLALFGYEANGTPYAIVLWPLIRVLGTAEAVLRLPAVIAGTGAVPALWWTARRLGAARAALLAAALLALNPMAVWYSQEARAYAFVVLSACLAFGALARALEQPPPARRAWAGYVAAMALLAYSELFAAPLALPAQLLMARRAGRQGMRRWLLSLAALAACCVPLLVAAIVSRTRRNALYWLPKPSRWLAELAVQEFTAGFSEVTAVRWVTLASAALLAVALWRALRRPAAAGRHEVDRGGRGTLAAVACWGLLPGPLLMAVSFATPVFWPRYAILALPGLCLLAALAVCSVWRRRRWAAPAAAAVGAILLASAYADARQRSYLQEDWPPIAAWLRSERAPGQPTIVDNALVLPSLGYYDPAFRARDGTLIVQEWRDRPLPAGVVGFKDPTGYGSVPNGPPGAATFARLARRGGEVWLIVAEADVDLQPDPRHGAAVAWARAHCRVQVRRSTGVWALRATACAG